MTPNRQSFASLYGLPESATWEQIYDTAKELRTKQLSNPRLEENIMSERECRIKSDFASLYGLPEDATWEQIFTIAKGEMEAASTDPICGNTLAELAAYKKKYGGLEK